MTDKTTADVMVPEVWLPHMQAAFSKTIYEKMGVKPPVYLPTPWYGRARNWLSGRITLIAGAAEALSEWLQERAWDVDYSAKVDPASIETMDVGREIEFHTVQYTGVTAGPVLDPYRYGPVPYRFDRRSHFEVDEPNG